MRLWHEELLPKLPRQQLLGQHRECAALLGKGWGRPHSIVNYVFKYDREKLKAYHYKVIDEMHRRGYKPAPEWSDDNYLGKTLGYGELDSFKIEAEYSRDITYDEHDDKYMIECLENLASKGITIEQNESEDKNE